MKKNILYTIVAAGMLTASFCAAPFAAASGVNVTVNGNTVDGAYKNGNHIMLPLRSVAQMLGFSVSWNGDSMSATLDNGEINTVVSIGSDNYFYTSSLGIGMSAPQTFGAAPELINDTTYVPAQIFALILGNDAVKTNGDTTEIRTVEQKRNTNEEANKSTDKKDKENSEITDNQCPSPIAEYDSVAYAKKAMGVSLAAPSGDIKGYKLSEVDTVSNEILQLIYTSDNDEITYRVSKSSGDISGDYNEYAQSKTIKLGDISILAKGNNGKIYNASFAAGTDNVSVMSANGIDEATLKAIAELVK